MTPFKVFGGQGHDLGHVRPLSPLTFADFVKETLCNPVLVNVTKAEFHALPKKNTSKDPREASKERTQANFKRIAYVTPAHFSSSRRLYENATTFNLIALDIDDPHQAAPFVSDPAQLNYALEPLSFAAYTTASSLPTAPKLRIFVQSDLLPVTAYSDAVRSVAARLGLPSITPESLVVVQPMYLPTMFNGDNPDTDHPVIAANWDGRGYNLGDVVQNGPSAAGKADSRPHVYSVDGDELDYLRPPVPAVELDDVRDALDKLDADMVYNDWLEVAAALRHQFPDDPYRERAYELFDEWSSTGSKYAGAEETRSKWDSLKPHPNKRAPVTIRTLLYKAQENGWDPVKLSSKCYGTTLKWVCDVLREAGQLMAEGIKRIAATPLLSPLERGTLLSALQDALKAKGAKVQRAELKKELRRLDRASTKREEVRVTPDGDMPPWARGITYVGNSNEFFHRVSGRKMKKEVLNSHFGAYLTDADSSTGKPQVEPSDFLLNVLKIPRVDGYRYDPARADTAFLQEGKLRYINTYLPTYPEAKNEKAEEAGAILLEHLTNLIAEDDYANIIVDWMAFQVQNPGVKIRWAPLIQSAEGAGKTFIPMALRAVLGNTNVNILDGTLMLQDKYTEWAAGSQLCAIEEIRVVGHTRHEVMNRLKAPVANDFVTVRDMYEKKYLSPNNVNYLLLTNYHDAIAVSDNDRRYFVLYSAIQSKAEVKALGEGYFDRLYAMLVNDASHLRSWLEEWKISDKFRPNGPAPVTKYLAELYEAGASPINSAVLDAIRDEVHVLVKWDLISSKHLKELVERQTGLPRFTDQTMGSALRELGYISLGRFRIAEERHYLWTRRGSPVTAESCADLARDRLAEAPKPTDVFDSTG